MANLEAQDALGARLAAVENAVHQPVVTVGIDGTIFGWNRAATLVYGYEAHKVAGKHLSVILPPEWCHELTTLLAAVASGEPINSHRTVHRSRGGRPVEVILRACPVTASNGDVIGAVIAEHNLTEPLERRADLSVARPDGLLQAEAADANARRFLADAAHQLRSPLASIQLCAETLLEQPEPAQRERFLANMIHQTARAGRLIRSLLRLAGLDEGEHLRLQTCDLVELCQQETDRIWHLAPQLDVVLHANAVLKSANVDRDAVQEILANLLENATRHARSAIEVVISSVDDVVEVSVADDGPGLPLGMEEEVFKRFVSLDAKGGSGLGLPIARELARAHGGDVTHAGGRFVVTLPLSGSDKTRSGES